MKISRPPIETLCVCLLAFAASSFLVPKALFGDGSTLAILYSGREYGTGNYIHAAYMPLARLLGFFQGLVSEGRSPVDVLSFVSRFAGSLGLAIVFASCRACNVSSLVALASVGLAATSSGFFFFTRVVEVHAVQFLGSSIALCLVVAYARHRVSAWLVMFLLPPILFLSHQTSLLLIPGSVAYVLAREWHLARTSREVWKRIVVIFIASVVGGIGGVFAAAWLREMAVLDLISGSTSLVHSSFQTGKIPALFRGQVLPLVGFWLLLLPVALARQPRTWPVRVALFISIGVPFLFFAIWGVPERGAYTLGYLPVMTLAVALLMERVYRRGLFVIVLWLVGFVGQSTLSVFSQVQFLNGRHGIQGRSSLEAVAGCLVEFQPPRLLVTIDPALQSVAGLVDGTLELRFYPHIRDAQYAGRNPQDWSSVFGQWLLDHAKEADVQLFLDRSYMEYEGIGADFWPYVTEFERYLDMHSSVEELLDGRVWVVDY